MEGTEARLSTWALDISGTWFTAMDCFKDTERIQLGLISEPVLIFWCFIFCALNVWELWSHLMNPTKVLVKEVGSGHVSYFGSSSMESTQLPFIPGFLMSRNPTRLFVSTVGQEHFLGRKGSNSDLWLATFLPTQNSHLANVVAFAWFDVITGLCYRRQVSLTCLHTNGQANPIVTN